MSALCPVGHLSAPWGEAVRRSVRFNSFRPGQVLLEQGEVGDRFRFIKTGLVMVRQLGADGAAHPIALVGRGYMVGLMGVGGHPSLTRLEAAGPVSVCEIPYDGLRRDGALEGRGAAVIHALNVRTFQVLTGWSRVMRIRSLPHRLAVALGMLALDQGERRLQLPSQRALAELLAVSRESVSRALDNLVEIGLLVRIHRGVVDVNLPALQAWVEALKPADGP
jgi:CRP-like cAMP-binding protein